MIIPLEQFFEDNEGTRLAEVARKVFARSFREKRFRAGLLEKLKRILYRDNRGVADQTFYCILEKTQRLNAVLRRSTMRELWHCLLIGKAIEIDLKLQKEHLTAIRTPVEFHREVAYEAMRHVQSLEALLKKYKVKASLIGHLPYVEKEIRPQLRRVAQSKFPGSRQELLSGRRSASVRTRNAEMAVQAAIYRVLTNKLQDTEAKKSPISNRFLRQLAQLVAQDPRNQSPMMGDSDDALRKFIERRRK
jgi:hypothetical protein